MLFDTTKNIGRAGLALAIAYFGANGYSVSIPLNDTQWYDLIIEKDGELKTVQCKATGSKDGRIDFRNIGYNGVYDIATNHPIDYLFCLNQNKTLFNIPTKDIPKNLKSIMLRTSPNANGIGFETYKYIVEI